MRMLIVFEVLEKKIARFTVQFLSFTIGICRFSFFTLKKINRIFSVVVASLNSIDVTHIYQFEEMSEITWNWQSKIERLRKILDQNDMECSFDVGQSSMSDMISIQTATDITEVTFMLNKNHIFLTQIFNFI